MSRELQTLSLAQRNQVFLDAQSKIDNAIQIRAPSRQNVFRSLIPRASYTLGEGLAKRAYRFFPGLGHQRGLNLWHAIQISRKASAGDPGYDATKYNPYSVTYGFDQVTYGGLGIEYATPSISIRDMRFMWEMKQQLAAIFGFLGDFTNDMWENYAREMYAFWCNSAANCYLMSSGTPGSFTFAYDPTSADTDGDNVLTIDCTSALPEIGILDWKPLRWLARYLQMQCPGGAIGNRDGRPVFGLVMDLEDFDRMIEEDAKLREDWRYARADMLIQNYGQTTEYKGFTLMHDMLTPRFAIKSKSTTALTLKRVDPRVSSTTNMLLGSRQDVNPDYLNAEFGAIFVYLKDVFQIEIPPAGPTSGGGGTSFGATPGLNGEWRWLNIQDAQENPLNEIGFWFMRAEAFAHPMANREEPVMLLYRRFTAITPIDTEIGGTAAAATRNVAADAATGDLDATNRTITLTLDGYLTAEAGQAITLYDDDGTTDVGVVADSSQAPTYTFALVTATSAYTKYTAAGAAKVVVG